jgi:hypothetical protein
MINRWFGFSPASPRGESCTLFFQKLPVQVCFFCVNITGILILDFPVQHQTFGEITADTVRKADKLS